MKDRITYPGLHFRNAALLSFEGPDCVFLVTIFDLGDIDMFRILLSFFSILGGGGYRNPVSEEWGRDP